MSEPRAPSGKTPYERDGQGYIRVGGWLGFVLLLHLALDASLWVMIALVDLESLGAPLESDELFDGAVAGAFWAAATILFFSRGPYRRHARRLALAAPLTSLAVQLFAATSQAWDLDLLIGFLAGLCFDGPLVAYLILSRRTRDTLHSHRPAASPGPIRNAGAWCSGLLGALLVAGCLPFALEGGFRLLLPVAAVGLVALFHVGVSALERERG